MDFMPISPPIPALYRDEKRVADVLLVGIARERGVGEKHAYFYVVLPVKGTAWGCPVVNPDRITF